MFNCSQKLRYSPVEPALTSIQDPRQSRHCLVVRLISVQLTALQANIATALEQSQSRLSSKRFWAVRVPSHRRGSAATLSLETTGNTDAIGALRAE